MDSGLLGTHGEAFLVLLVLLLIGTAVIFFRIRGLYIIQIMRNSVG